MNNYTHDILLGLKYVLSALTATYVIKTIKEMYQFQHPPQRVINMHGGVINVFMALGDDVSDDNSDDDDVVSDDNSDVANNVNDILSDFNINLVDMVPNDDVSNDATPNDVAPNDGSCDEANVAKSSDDAADIVLLSDGDSGDNSGNDNVNVNDNVNDNIHQHHTYTSLPTQATTLGFSQLVPNFIHKSANF